MWPLLLAMTLRAEGGEERRTVAPSYYDGYLKVQVDGQRLSWTGKATLTVTSFGTGPLLLRVQEPEGGTAVLTSVHLAWTDGAWDAELPPSASSVSIAQPLPDGTPLTIDVRWTVSASWEAVDDRYLRPMPVLARESAWAVPHRIAVDLPADAAFSVAASGVRTREEVLGPVRRLVSQTGPDAGELPVIRFGRWEPNPYALGPGILARLRQGTQLELEPMAAVIRAELDVLYELLGPPACSELELVEQELRDSIHWTAFGCIVTIGRYRADRDVVAYLDHAYTATSEYFLAHELAHLWFPGTVAARSDAEEPLMEAMAEYYACRVLERTRSAKACERRYAAAELSMNGKVNLFRGGPFDSFDQQSTGLAYSRWVLAMRALEARVGRPVLDPAMASLMEARRRASFGFQDLEQALQGAGGGELGPFLATWRAPEVPRVTSVVDGERVALRVSDGTWEVPWGRPGAVQWVRIEGGAATVAAKEGDRFDPDGLFGYQHVGR